MRVHGLVHTEAASLLLHFVTQNSKRCLELFKKVLRITQGFTKMTMLQNLVQDIQYGMRKLRRSPLFALTVVLTVMIGIAAGTTVFTVANALLFREPVGVADPGRLIDIGVSFKGQGFSSGSYPNYIDIKQRATMLAGMYAHPRFPSAMSLRT